MPATVEAVDRPLTSRGQAEDESRLDENEMAAKKGERTVSRRMTGHSLIAESLPNTVSFASYVWSRRIPIVKARNWVKSPSRER